jgi:hypothetical protein
MSTHTSTSRDVHPESQPYAAEPKKNSHAVNVVLAIEAVPELENPSLPVSTRSAQDDMQAGSVCSVQTVRFLL